MNTQDRFDELWTDYLEGDLDADGVEKLRELLAADETLLKQAADLFQTHRLLGLSVEEEPTRQDEFVRETLALLPESHDGFVGQVMSSVDNVQREEAKLNSGRQPRRVVSLRAWGAALLLLTATLLFVNRPMDPEQRVTNEGAKNRSQPEQDVINNENSRDDVILTQAAGAELFGEFLPAVGNAIEFNHEYALVSGLIELRFPDGAEVIMEAPGIIEITGREHLLVSTGNCSVHAPPGAEGFQVETPQTEITDLGTRFSVSVSEVGETDVQVVEGLAEVVLTHDESAQPVRLAEREARRFNGDTGGKPLPLEFDFDEYRRSLPDRIVRYDVGTTDEGYAWDLQSVTVQRDGVVRTYPIDVLVGVKVIHFRAGDNKLNVIVPVGYEGDRLASLESDALLHTGIINPGGSAESLQNDAVLGESDEAADLTPGMALQFREAVVNRPGPDVVFFELQTVTNPLEGDAFHVSPLRFEEGLRSHTIRRYDITMTSPEAKPLPDIDLLFASEPASSLQSLTTGPVTRRIQKLRFFALAVAIDLSDLGFADNAPVDGLFLQDVLDDEGSVDPVFVAGLP